MIFKNEEHKKAFEYYTAKDKTESWDVERISLFYLLALSDDTRRNIKRIYNFEERCIEPTELEQGWQTSGSKRVTKLAFNLFNGFRYEEFGDFSPLELFATSDAPYMVEALKLRHRIYFQEGE